LVVEEQAPLAAHPQGVQQSDTLFDFAEPLYDFSERSSHRTRTAASGNPLLTLVNQTGVFDMEILFCICPNAGDKDEQLLKAGLLSSSFRQIETAFTFSVLDDFLTDNLECKTTAQQYYSKLQSITNRMFPDHVPVCHDDSHYTMAYADYLITGSLQTALEGISPMA
jgi:CxC2 like cysteine cluster associated with KDZ transposases